MEMELFTMSHLANGIIGLLSVFAYLFVMGIAAMWLSSFYILNTWWDSHRIKGTSSSSSISPASVTSRQLKKINSFIAPVTTTDILLN